MQLNILDYSAKPRNCGEKEAEGRRREGSKGPIKRKEEGCRDRMWATLGEPSLILNLMYYLRNAVLHTVVTRTRVP